MALEYKTESEIAAIAPILDEYVVWYGQLMRAYFERANALPVTPSSFEPWVEQAVEEGRIDPDSAATSRKLHADMIKSGTMFIARAMMWDVNPLKEFNDFTLHYEEFIHFMRRVEREQVLEGSGIDCKTGLRSTGYMKDDLRRELERRARKGSPFGMGLVKINNYTPEWSAAGEGFYDIVRNIAAVAKECLRSFDDAYYLGDQYFLAVFKQADWVGMQAAAGRLSDAVDAAALSEAVPSGHNVSVSVVLAEPVPGDDLDALLENMKKDLEGVNGRGTVLQYNDLSPLQRFADTIKKDRT